MAISRGLRNKNPLNIRVSDNLWIGKIAGTDKQFETFDTVVHGVRAAMICMRTHIRRANGKLSLVSLICKWAPANDGNNPSVYAACVILFANCWGVELDADWLVDVSHKQKFCALVRAMARVECGSDIGQSVVEAAYNMVLV